MNILLALLLAQFPAVSETSWMEPAAFRLALGDSRAKVERHFRAKGWGLTEEDDSGELVHDYGDGKTVVMQFSGDTLVSVRFELVQFLPGIAESWESIVARLGKKLGVPRIVSPVLAIHEKEQFTVHAVLSSDPASSLGRQGLGRIIVRYFVPPEPSADPPPASTG
jgi:hypothetical protein